MIPLTPQGDLERFKREELEMTSSTDNSSLYVLISSTFGTIVGLAAVWIVTVQSFTPVLGA
jgi:hypothetical protein